MLVARATSGCAHYERTGVILSCREKQPIENNDGVKFSPMCNFHPCNIQSNLHLLNTVLNIGKVFVINPRPCNRVITYKTMPTLISFISMLKNNLQEVR